MNSGLIQIGVVSRCTAGLQVNVAFYQVLPQNPTAQYLNPVTYPVLTGEFMVAEIRNTGADRYSISLRGGWWNYRNNVTYGGTPRTAEWVVESGARGESVDALSDFGTVHFEGAFFNEELVAAEDTNKFIATGEDGRPKTIVGDIGQFGGRGPNFDVVWLRS